MGEPTRIVVGGIGPIPGASIRIQKEYFAANLDHIRTALLHEPRGHSDMFGAVLLPPNNDSADLAVFFMDDGGYLDMCGHGIVGASVAAIETGFVPITEPLTELRVETPAGLINIQLQVLNKIIGDVTVTNVDSFLYESGVNIDLGAMGQVNVDISYGGNFFALVDTNDLGFDLTMDNLGRFIETGMLIKNTLAGMPHPIHPTLGTLPVSLIEFSKQDRENRLSARNLVVFGKGQFDRSPCGTGTCAKMASLYAKSKLGLNEPFIHQSIINTTFTGMLTAESKINDQQTVTPQITARAYIIGIQQFVLNSNDPLCDGFYMDRAGYGSS